MTTTETTFKTKSLAVQAAHAELGAEAIEGLDFLARNTGAGWEYEAVGGGAPKPAAVDPHPVLQPGQDVDPALVVDGHVYGNKTRAAEARRAKAKAATMPARAAKEAAKPRVKAQKAKRGTAALDEALGKREAVLEQQVADAPKPARAPRPKSTDAETPKAPRGKTGALIAMVQRPEGATMPQLIEASGWAEQSIKWFMNGTLKKKGLPAAVCTDGIWRIPESAPAADKPAAEEAV